MKSSISLLLKAEDGLPISQFESKSMLARRTPLSSAIYLLRSWLPHPNRRMRKSKPYSTASPEVRTALLPMGS